MGRLCGGAHEISGIPAPLWLCGWVVERIMGWVGGGYVGCGAGGWVGYYNFHRSTNKIKSFDKILTSEKNYIFCIFLLWGGGQT